MWYIDANSISQLFPEIEYYAKKCQLDDCNHIQDQGCAVKKAVNERSIRKDRYDSYITLKENSKVNQQKVLLTNKEDLTKIGTKTDSLESVLKTKFKINIKENQKILNIENNIKKLTIEEKTECLELIYKLPYLEILDISNNGEIALSQKINDLKNLKKLRIDENAINTPGDKEIVDKLTERGIKVVIYSAK